jgi:nucleotide-binding universal stress UspA family protein
MSATDRWANPAAILVATDISDLDRLMPYAFEMAAETGARILLLHVLTVGESVSTDIPGMLYLDPIGAMDSAETAIEHWSKLARTQGLPCETFFRQGNAAQEIVTAVRYLHADRLILGTRSRSKLSKLLVGSVAEQVLRSVSLPVITVGPEAHLPFRRQQPAKDGAARHYAGRDLSPERSACLSNCSKSEGQTDPAACVAFHGRVAEPRLAGRFEWGGCR